MKKLLLILPLLLITASLHAQSLKKEIDSIYHFSPQRLTDQEKSQNSAILDLFWEKVKSDTALYLPMLREELQAADHQPFFYYDGAALLIASSGKLADKQLAAQAIASCDLEDISRREYVAMLNRLAHLGIDVSEAAVKILSDPEFSFFIPQHVMSFNQGYCLSYSLLPLPPALYVTKLGELLYSLKEVTSKKSIITTLWFACSCEGDMILRKAMVDPKLAPEVRDYANKIMSYTKIPRQYKKIAKHFSEEHVQVIRSKSLKRFSDEAISELDLTTRLMRKEGRCQ